MNPAPSLVAIITPQPIVERGLAALLAGQSELERVDAGPRMGAPAPDVVLYDVLSLHVGDGADLDQLALSGRSRVLALGRDLRPGLLASALVRGADAFVSLGASEEALLRAIADLVVDVDATADRRRRGSAGRRQSRQRRHLLGLDVELTDREIDVLELIAQGLSNHEVAEHCFLSINSVKTYIRGAYRKIGVGSRSQAVVWCMQHGFAPDPVLDPIVAARVG